MLAWAGESQYYAEPKRLARLGYLEARQRAGQDAGAHGLHADREGARRARDYARTPVSLHAAEERPAAPPADLRSRRRGPVTRASLRTLREDIADLMLRLDDAEETARAIDRTGEVSAARRSTSCARYLDLHLDLVDQVEREFSATRRPEGTAESART